MRLALSCLLALCAAAAPGARAADTKAATAERPLIERTFIVAPEKIGEFALDDVYYDEANRYSGARFRYVLPGHQETRFDVFVYPAGRMPQAQAIASGMTGFKDDIELAQKAGYYRDVEFLGEEDFPLDATKPSATAASGGGDKEAKLLAIINAANPVGRRLRMQYTQLPGEFAMRSNGYLFHRQLFYFKARISAARERLAEAEFATLADRAARELAGAIDAFNLGGCANRTIEINPDASPDLMAEVLVRRTTEIQGENCIAAVDDPDLAKKSKAARVVTIEFSPDDWKSE